VLQRPCPECGLDTQGFAREAIGGMVRDNAAEWQAVLSGPADARLRPSPDKWSALFPNWDQDATAVADRYDQQDPAGVANELAQAAEGIAAQFDRLSADQWERTGSRSDGAQFTVESFGRYFIHDPVHHLYDVTGTR